VNLVFYDIEVVLISVSSTPLCACEICLSTLSHYVDFPMKLGILDPSIISIERHFDNDDVPLMIPPTTLSHISVFHTVANYDPVYWRMS